MPTPPPPPPVLAMPDLDEAVHRLALRSAAALWSESQPPDPGLLRRELDALLRQAPAEPSRSLLEALRGILRLRAGDEGGEAEVLRAAQTLESRARKATGYARIPELKALRDLCRMAGAPERGWLQQTVQTRLALSRTVDPELEQEALALAEAMFGGWMEPPDRPGTLQACQWLADLWLRRPDATFTPRVLQQGFPPQASTLWAYAARHGDPALRATLIRLLDRLAPPPSQVEPLLEVLTALHGTPLHDAAQRLVRRIQGTRTAPHRRLSETWDAPADQVTHLMTALAGPEPPEDDLLAWAGRLLDRQQAPALAKRAFACLQTRWAKRDTPLATEVEPEAWANHFEAQGLWEEAGASWRRALQPVQAARCLARMGRWDEALALLADSDASEADLLRAQAAAQGPAPETARPFLLRWLAALGNEPPLAEGAGILTPLLAVPGEACESLARKARPWVQAGQLPPGLTPPQVMGWLDPLAPPPPDLLPAHAGAWKLHHRLERPHAIPDLEEALKAPISLPRLAAVAWLRLSNLKEEAGDAAGSLDALKQALALQPEMRDREIARELRLLAVLEQWKSAEERLMEHIRLLETQTEPDPEAFQAAVEGALPLISLLDVQGRHGEALALLQRGEVLARRLAGPGASAKEGREAFSGPGLARFKAQLALKTRLRRLVPLG